MIISEIFLLQSTVNFDIEYSYLVGEELAKDLIPGVFVIVPFGNSNKKVTGLVWRIHEQGKSQRELKWVQAIEKSILPLTQGALLLAEWMRKRYICTMGDAVKCMLPPAENKGKPVRAAKIIDDKELVLKDIKSGVINKIHYVNTLELLLNTEEPITLTELSQAIGCSTSIFNTLAKKGYINFVEVSRTKKDVDKDESNKIYPPHKLNEEQMDVFCGVSKMLSSGNFGEALIQGVTGSGKTEIYMQLISYILDRGGNAIVLVPEISLTPQMTSRFKGRFGERVAILHSRLGDSEKRRQWKLAQEGKVSIVVGARSAVFAPFDKVDLIILDEEQETSYKSENSPRYHAAEIAKQRCTMDKGVVIYGSATPLIETFYNAKQGIIEYFTLKKRANKGVMPPVKIVDMKQELENGNRSIFSTILKNEILKNIESGQQTIIFVNRRGYSGVVLCHDCGNVIKCKSCNIPMTYHSSVSRLICHYCGNTQLKTDRCPKCDSKNVKNIGLGTQRIEEQLKLEFPGSTVIRMDTDTTGGKNSHKLLLDRFVDEKTNFLVGTQMVAKGHDFPNVTLVGIISADSLINIEDFRASERAFQLMCQVAGRAGRAELPGRVIIQAFNIDDYSIITAASHNYDDFYKREIKVRESLYYPPFCNIAVISLIGSKDREVFDECQEFKKKLIASKTIEIEILGPTRPNIPKINDKYKWRIILKAPNENILINLLSQYRNNPLSKNNISVIVDINPRFML